MYEPKQSPSSHKGREFLPLVVLIRNKLKYALTYYEVTTIVVKKHIYVDGKFRTNSLLPYCAVHKYA